MIRLIPPTAGVVLGRQTLPRAPFHDVRDEEAAELIEQGAIVFGANHGGLVADTLSRPPNPKPGESYTDLAHGVLTYTQAGWIDWAGRTGVAVVAKIGIPSQLVRMIPPHANASGSVGPRPLPRAAYHDVDAADVAELVAQGWQIFGGKNAGLITSKGERNVNVFAGGNHTDLHLAKSMRPTEPPGTSCIDVSLGEVITKIGAGPRGHWVDREGRTV